jgi:hypothetical protein
MIEKKDWREQPSGIASAESNRAGLHAIARALIAGGRNGQA